MILFWSLATGLVALALLFVLPSLLSRGGGHEKDREQDRLALTLFQQQVRELDADLAAGTLAPPQYQAACRDLERELLQDVADTKTEPPRPTGSGRWAAGLLAALLPTTAFSLYLYLGNSTLIPHLATAAATQTPGTHPGPSGELPPLEVMVQRLVDKLKQHPDNPDGWMMLGRTYFVIDQPGKAREALEQAYGLAPDNPDILVAYAEAIAATNHSKLVGHPAELIRAALKIDPEHTSARWLAGLVSFQAARYGQAVEQWEALVATFGLDSKEAAELSHYIAEARSRTGPGHPDRDEQSPVPASEGISSDRGEQSPDETGTATSGGAIRVEVTLAEHLWPQANVNDPVFIYAKAVAGPPMPLAARRAQVANLPATLTLDDSLAINPAMKLSGFPQVTIIARISKSGQATPQSGDLEGMADSVTPGRAGTVPILIDRIRP